MATVYRTLAAFLLVIIAACGGGGGDSTECSGYAWQTFDENHFVERIVVTNDSDRIRQVEVFSALTWTFPKGIANQNQVRGWLVRSDDPKLGDSAFAQYTRTVSAEQPPPYSWDQRLTDTLQPGQTAVYLLVAYESAFRGCVVYSDHTLAAGWLS